MSPAVRLIRRFAPVEPREAPAITAAFCLYFCMLAGYFAVRPIRETLGTVLGRDRVTNIFLATWIASIAVVPLYGWVVAKFRRSTFLPAMYAIIALVLAGVGVAMHGDEASIAVGQFFYVFISVINFFMVSVFWSFMLELLDGGQVKRLFGVVAAGGTAGALMGPFLTDQVVGYVGNSGVLFLGASLFALAIVFQRRLLSIWRDSWDVPSAGVAGDTTHAPVHVNERDKAIGGNPFAGFTLVLRSPYLLAIALFVVFLSAMNTFLYFEQLRLVEQTFPDMASRTRVFARIDWIVQALTIVAQVYITGRIASRMGLTVLLMVVPLVMIAGFATLTVLNTFAVVAVVMIVRRTGEYALVRPGREMLFSRFDMETKYKAKNLIDVPVYRGADALVAQARNVVESAGMTPLGMAWLGAGVAVLGAINGWWLGRRHDRDVAAHGE